MSRETDLYEKYTFPFESIIAHPHIAGTVALAKKNLLQKDSPPWTIQRFPLTLFLIAIKKEIRFDPVTWTTLYIEIGGWARTCERVELETLSGIGWHCPLVANAEVSLQPSYTRHFCVSRLVYHSYSPIFNLFLYFSSRHCIRDSGRKPQNSLV